MKITKEVDLLRGKYDIFSKIPLNLFLLARHMGESNPVSGSVAQGLQGEAGAVHPLNLLNLGEIHIKKEDFTWGEEGLAYQLERISQHHINLTFARATPFNSHFSVVIICTPVQSFAEPGAVSRAVLPVLKHI